MLRVVAVLLAVALTVYAVIECIQSDDDRVRILPRLAWLALIVLVPVVGSLAWFFIGRPPKGRPPGRPARPLGPDDDPDFLRKL